MAEPHPCNAPGDFYVENGCCITCGVPHAIAPELFAWTDDDGHCFVRRQPQGDEEVDLTVRALWSSEVSCIRYRGRDPVLLQRIAALGLAECCDVDPGAVDILIRNRVTFRSDAAAATLCERFRNWLARPDETGRMIVRPPSRWRPLRVIFSWEGAHRRWPRFNAVDFASAGEGRLEIRLKPGRWAAAHGLALMIHGWLSDEAAVSEISWTAASERARGAPGFRTPI